jgi:hypothetical protein
MAGNLYVFGWQLLRLAGKLRRLRQRAPHVRQR